MKKIFLSLILLAIYSLTYAQQKRTCGSHEHHLHLLQTNPDYVTARALIQQQTETYEASPQKHSRNVITIPVVVHVVYHTAAQNISDAQIQSQITVLNNDFRKLNADRTSVPAVFANIAADFEVQFCLAQRTPAGLATTGIVRKSTVLTSFIDDDKVKYTSQGGDDAWDRNQYLNLWVCNLGGGLLGYAQFPGGPAATDGVVFNYTAFGTMGTAAAPYNKGRTATHEIGHWLNLYHIWGDDGTACTGSDQVSDTPNQADENYGCPTFSTNHSCSNNGDMSMNYMDYTDDACMYMFTTGQKTRSRALFAAGGARASLTTSPGCSPPAPALCNTPTGLNTTNIATTSATVNWSAVLLALSYNLQYRTVGAANWIMITNVAGTSRNLTGLVQGTVYEFRVSTVCALGTGVYSPIATFTTSAAPPAACIDVYEANETLGAAKYIAINTNITARIGTITDIDYFRFTTTANVRNIRAYLTNLPGDYDLYLFNSAGTLIGSAENGGNISETITYNTGTYGTFYLKVVGYNGANSPNCYSLIANTSAAAWLRMQDPDNDEIENETVLNIYPNPANDKVFVQFFAKANETVQMNVYNTMGQKILSENYTSAGGENKHMLDLKHVSNGLYILEFFSGEERKVQKFMIQK